jgi:undecaprenyl pyrophosphate phosphatase UppP
MVGKVSRTAGTALVVIGLTISLDQFEGAPMLVFLFLLPTMLGAAHYSIFSGMKADQYFLEISLPLVIVGTLVRITHGLVWHGAYTVVG